MENKNNIPISLGTELEIIRQRLFIDYTSKDKKYYVEEFTIVCRSDIKSGIDNIFLKIPEVLPNLTVVDSDGEELPIITNKLTEALLRNRIKIAPTKQIRDALTEIQTDLEERKYYLLWIKLPNSKRLLNGDAKVFTLNYDASREDLHAKNHLQQLNSEIFEVFYVIKAPEDYQFKKTEIEIYDSSGDKLKRHEKKWINKKGDPIYCNEKANFLSIRVRPEITDKILLTYSFKPSSNIVNLPRIMFSFLFVSALFLVLPKLFGYTQIGCGEISFCIDLNHIFMKNVEIGIGIIGASLILAGLVHNHDIRDSLKYYFFIPLILGVIGIVL